MLDGRGLVLAFAALLVAGCTSAPAPASRAALVNAPDATALLPTVADLPDGFHVGFAQRQKEPLQGAVDSATIVFEDNNETTRDVVTAGALLFGSPQEAAAARAWFASQESSSALVLQDNETTFFRETYSSPEPGGEATRQVVVAQRGLVVVWLLEMASGRDARLDVVPLAGTLLDRADAAFT